MAIFLLGTKYADEVTRAVTAKALSVYLLPGVAWSLFYQGFAIMDTSAFNVSVAIASAGPFDRMDFADQNFISPVAPLAQSSACAEAVTGVLYVAVLVARLVSAYRR